MLAKLQSPSGNGSFVAHIHLTTKDAALDTAALIRGSDFRVTTVIDGSTYVSGRSGGYHWRRTPAGSVRIIRTDVQSDDLDRWPETVFGFDRADCTAAGQSTENAQPVWVLGCRSPFDIAHWYYIDPSSGQIKREITREGSHVVEYRFADFSERAGHVLPGAWHISGYGGDADASITDIASMTVSPADVALPQAVPEQFVMPPSGTLSLPAHFGNDHISVPVRIDGHRLDFVVDTGTTQMLMDIGAAVRLGLHPVLNHAIAKSVDVDGLVARDLPIETVDLFGGGYIVGLLGNEFFTGHIVHLNYATKTLELISHKAFTPPTDAREIDVDTREGMPIVSMMVGSVPAARCAIDTGSYSILFASDFLQQAGSSALVQTTGRPYYIRFLEGPVMVANGSADSLSFDEVRFGQSEVMNELSDADNLDIPLDCILGSQFLRTFEWWFDYDTNHAWIRVSR